MLGQRRLENQAGEWVVMLRPHKHNVLAKDAGGPKTDTGHAPRSSGIWGGTEADAGYAPRMPASASIASDSAKLGDCFPRLRRFEDGELSSSSTRLVTSLKAGVALALRFESGVSSRRRVDIAGLATIPASIAEPGSASFTSNFVLRGAIFCHLESVGYRRASTRCGRLLDIGQFLPALLAKGHGVFLPQIRMRSPAICLMCKQLHEKPCNET